MAAVEVVADDEADEQPLSSQNQKRKKRSNSHEKSTISQSSPA